MIRFVKNILDIKNVLGMQRPQPLPEYPAGQTVIRAAVSHFSTVPIYTGDLTIQYISGGTEHTDVRTPGGSGTTLWISCDVGTDIVLSGDLQQLTINTNQLNLFAVGNTLTQFSMYDGVETLDLRNADVLSSTGYTMHDVAVFYAIATTPTARGISDSIINGSNIADGVLWIDRTQPYADSVIAAARAKGWKVYYL